MHCDVSDDLLAQEVPASEGVRSVTAQLGCRKEVSVMVQNPPNFHMVESLGVLLNIEINGEMGVDVAHLVLVSLCDANDQVLDERLYGSEGCDILSRAMVDFDLDDLLSLLALGHGECDGDVGEVFGQFACKGRCQSTAFRHGLSLRTAVFRCWILVPRGPSTETMRERIWTLTSSGMTSCSCEKMYFILSSGIG